MEARIFRSVVLTAALLVSMGARHRSANFIVETPDPNLARQFAEAAEKYRRDLAVEWLGQAMPNWSQPCPMTVRVGPQLGAGGATTFVFDRGEVFGWRMTIQGSAERVLDSVLPHEITHMIFASHFRQPLPRWADEGGATTVENIAERSKYQKMLDQFLRTGRGIAFNRMFAMTDYPSDVMPLYAQCYSLAEYLIQVGGRRKYVEFLDDGLKNGNWSAAVARNYGMGDLGRLQNTWLAWVKQGSPALNPAVPAPGLGASGELLASNAPRGLMGAGLIQGQPALNRPAVQPTVIPAGRLTPVPGEFADSSANLMAVAENRGTSPGYGRDGVRLASAVAAMPASGWKTAGNRQSGQSAARDMAFQSSSASPAAVPSPMFAPPAEDIAQASFVQPENSTPAQARTLQNSTPPAADPFQTLSARPQDAEQPRQVILEWSAR